MRAAIATLIDNLDSFAATTSLFHRNHPEERTDFVALVGVAPCFNASFTARKFPSVTKCHRGAFLGHDEVVSLLRKQAVRRFEKRDDALGYVIHGDRIVLAHDDLAVAPSVRRISVEADSRGAAIELREGHPSLVPRMPRSDARVASRLGNVPLLVYADPHGANIAQLL